MGAEQGLRQRWENMQPTKTVLVWSCAACTVGAIVLGFTWGGWTTGSTARSMAAAAAAAARDQVVAAFCVERFNAESDAAAQLVALKAMRNWDRNTFIEKGGWATMPGQDSSSGAARLCAEQLAAL